MAATDGSDLEWEVRLFGPVVVRRRGDPLPITALKHRMLVGVLALRAGDDVASDVLVDALWSGRAPRTATKALRVYVSELRKILERDAPTPRILTSHPSGYRLSITADAVDVRRFERLWQDGRSQLVAGEQVAARSALAEALALAQAEPLMDLRYEEFFAPEARRLEEMWIGCLEDRVEADLALGEHGGVIAELESLVERYPLRERLLGQLMLALYRAGRQADSLALYRAARENLLDGHGIDPSPALAALERRILQQDETLVAPLANARAHDSAGIEDTPDVFGLPSPVSSLIGREEAVTELAELLADADTRLLTLTGAGGSGKTRLSVEVAWRSTQHFRAGVGFVELAPLNDPSLVPAAIGSAFNVEQFDDQTMQDAVIAFLRRREFLLVLDNFEHVLEAWGVVSSLLRSCPRLKVLVTSRTRLRITGEVEYPVEPLAENAALELLIARLRNAGARHAWGPDELDVGTEICRQLDCLPLAIELVAARGTVATPTQLLSGLENRLAMLSAGARDLPSRQQTLRATLDWSYGLLKEEEQRDLNELSVFTGGATVEAIESVLSSGDAAAVEALIEASLLRRSPAGPDGIRIEMLETVREYAAECIDSAAEMAVRSRHARYFCAVASDAAAAQHGPDQVAWFDRLDREHANLRSALGWLTSTADVEDALALAADLAWFWYVRGYWTEGRAWLARVVDLEGGAETQRARALIGAGMIAREQGELAVARSLLERSIALSVGDDHVHGLAMNELAGVALYEEDPASAIKTAETALSILDRSTDRRRLGEVIGNVALITHALRDPDPARLLFERALTELECSGDVYASILVRNNFYLCLSERADSDLTAIRQGLLETLSILDPLRARKLEFFLLDSIAFVSLRMGDLAGACEYHRRNLEGVTAVESLRIQSGVLETAGVLAARSGRPRASVAILLVADRLRDLADMTKTVLAEAQLELDPAALKEISETAATMSVNDAIELALDDASVRT
jgi:predicted ATPase/DNA-binding SARP family transcriptional activator